MRRHKGFVVRPATRRDKIIWKVVVKDPDSEHQGKLFVVASVHDGIALSQGLNVNFLIGSVDDEEGNLALRAVDVRLEEPPGSQS